MGSKPAQADWNGVNRREEAPQGWHLKKEVNLTIIISVIGIAITAVMGYADLKRDVALIQADNLVLHSIDARMLSEVREDRVVIRENFKDISLKLDRLVERERK